MNSERLAVILRWFVARRGGGVDIGPDSGVPPHEDRRFTRPSIVLALAAVAFTAGCAGEGPFDVEEDAGRWESDVAAPSSDAGVDAQSGPGDASDSHDASPEADVCITQCGPGVCGDGLVDADEVCDDGNTDSGDGCSSNCLSTEVCGNGVLDTAAGEACDDGNATPGDGCSGDCRSGEICGNGIVDPGEVCDPMTTTPTCAQDGCRSDCMSDCSCGNGLVDASAGEECDPGEETDDATSDACRTDCTMAACGDGTVDPEEVCDDGDNVGGDGCAADCQSDETCGNAIVDSRVGEVCDDGNDVDGDGCSADCGSTEVCGNGVVDTPAGEMCDDGNTSGGDGCSANCESDETCGNGVVDAGNNEECDDGNSLSGDGCSASCSLEPGGVEWAKGFGGGRDDWGAALATDGTGVYLTGTYHSDPIDFGGMPLHNTGGGFDVFVTRFDMAGSHVWSKKFPGPGTEQATALALDPSGNLVVGGIVEGDWIDLGGGPMANADPGDRDVFLGSLDAMGNHRWSHVFGDSAGDSLVDVATDGSGNVYAAGKFAGGIDLGGGTLTNGTGWSGWWLAKFDSTGSHLWSKAFAGVDDSDFLRDLAVDGSDNVFLIGSIESSYVDFGGGQLQNAGGRGTRDVALASFDSAGNHRWSTTFGGNDHDRGRSVATNVAGEVWLTGKFSSSSVDFGGGPLQNTANHPMYLVKLDSNGGHVWSKSFEVGGLGHGAADLEADSAGSVLLTGDFRADLDLGGRTLTQTPPCDANQYWDTFVGKFDDAGNHTWSYSFGSCYEDSGASLASTPAGRTYVTGYFSGTADFQGRTLTSAGLWDVFVVSLAP